MVHLVILSLQAEHQLNEILKNLLLILLLDLIIHVLSVQVSFEQFDKGHLVNIIFRWIGVELG